MDCPYYPIPQVNDLHNRRQEGKIGTQRKIKEKFTIKLMESIKAEL